MLSAAPWPTQPRPTISAQDEYAAELIAFTERCRDRSDAASEKALSHWC